MKKLISLFLSLVMLLSAVISVDFSAFANPSSIDTFTLNPAKPYEVIFNTNGCLDEYNNVWYYYSPSWNKGDIITVNYNDGSTEEFVCDGWNFYNSNEERLNVNKRGFYFDGVGEASFEVYLKDYNASINVPVTVIENPVLSFTFTPTMPYEIIENTNGYYDDDANAWYYNCPDWEKGDVITVNYKDGTIIDYTCSGWDFRDSNGESLYVDKDNFYFNGTGEASFEIELCDYDMSIDVPVTIIENPVSHFTLTSVKPYEIIENTHGNYEDYENVWCYEPPNWNEGDKITVYYTNGDTEDFYSDGCLFYNSSNENLKVTEHHFKFDGIGETEFRIELDKYNKAINVPVTIIENPVSSFTLTPVNPYEVIIDKGDYDEYEGIWYFGSPAWNEGDVITVNYKNGTKDDFIYDGVEFYNNDGECVNVKKHGFETNGAGKTTFEIWLSDYLIKIDCPVTVIENPIASFKLTPVNPYEYIVNTNGYYDEYENSWYYYSPDWNEGDVITVTYTNGTTDDFVYHEGKFVNSDDEQMNVFGYGFYFDGVGETTFEIELYDYEKSIQFPITIIDEHVHDYSSKVIPPTCLDSGYTVFTCSCGDSYIGNYTNAKGHKYDAGKVTKAATCKATGVKTYTCTVCKATKTETIAKKAHTYKNYVTKATLTANGKIVNKCSVCGVVKSTTAIPMAKTFIISATNYTYDGKVKTPAVTVKDSKGNTLRKGTDYDVTYSSGRKNVGKYAVKITLKGNYYGTKTLYFNINPKGTTIAKLTPKSKSFTVQWNKQTNQTTGYQIQYSVYSNFSGAKTITMPKNTYYAKSVTGLSGNKRYYVRVRTYKTVKFNGKNYNLYSPWSSAKYTTTKK